MLIDIHTHIAPAVDDGARSAEMARAMLEEAKAQGVTSVILTPHYNENTGMIQPPESGFLAAEHIAGELGLRVYKGNEIYCSSGAMDKLKEGTLYTLAGTRYVLAEFSYSDSFDTLRKGINEFILRGYHPVIAHVERYSAIYKNYVYDFLNMGALLQINAGSVLSGGLKVKGMCKRLLKEGLVSFIASDCHNLSERAPNLGPCEAYVRKKYGEAYSEDLFCNNAQRLIAGADIVV